MYLSSTFSKQQLTYLCKLISRQQPLFITKEKIAKFNFSLTNYSRPEHKDPKESKRCLRSCGNNTLKLVVWQEYENHSVRVIVKCKKAENAWGT